MFGTSKAILAEIDNPLLRLNIEGILYEVTTGNPDVGDRVIDLRDGCTGIVDTITPEGDGIYASVRDGWVTEVGIPIERLKKLKISSTLRQVQEN